MNNSNKNAAQSVKSNYGAESHGSKKSGKLVSAWNSFASKKVSSQLPPKLTLSIRSESQLVGLGLAKDIVLCQSYTALKSSEDQSRRCKNLVNLAKQSSHCTYHCVQLSKSSESKVGGGKYSMASGNASYSRPGLPASTPISSSSEVKFAKPSMFGGGGGGAGNSYGFNHWNSSSLNDPNSPANRQAARERANKSAAEMKASALLSLNASITQTLSSASPVLSSASVRLNCVAVTAGAQARKKSDREIMAELEGKELPREEILQIRLAEQQPVNFTKCPVYAEQNRELKKVCACACEI